jgi:hypothetical protein
MSAPAEPVASAPAVPGDAAPVPPPPRGSHVALLYGSDLDGAYETCGCPVHPMGGIARRATQIDRARAEADAVLVVDAGNLFWPSRVTPGKPPDPGELERRARLLATGYGRMGTTAYTPGARDLGLGVALLARLAKQAGLPVISANLRGPGGALLFEADRIVTAAGLKVGLFGVTAAPGVAGVEAGDPAEAARDEVRALRARGASVIVALIGVGGPPDTRAWLASIPGIDWAVAGGTGLRLDTPETAGGARMLAAMAEGKELGRLDLHVVGGSLTFADRGERAEVETILADHRRQLVDYDRRLGSVDPASLRDYYETRRHQIELTIARETALLARLPRRITGSWFENRLIPLDAATPDQNGVAVLVEAYNRESARRAAAGRPVGIESEPHGARPAPADAAGGATSLASQASLFLGSPACGGCHAPALAFWKTTKHARALGALARIGRSRDPSCVGCHVTGYLQPGGFTLGAGLGHDRVGSRELRSRPTPSRGARDPPRVPISRTSAARPATARARPTRRRPTRPRGRPAPSPRRSASAATPPTSPTASSTTRSSPRRSWGRATARASRPCPAQLSRPRRSSAEPSKGSAPPAMGCGGRAAFAPRLLDAKLFCARPPGL